ncbi:odorant receptor 94a-like isoform X2 [Vespa velutina]|uniref:odorant receptor 94a-like isoform X2 n=1 Tax=Vespa velutina TaxID=202808 RepID=UPI001FB45470|nr:odorant receptor 94a-like isoform X2 [Vespa velutina]
MSKNKLSAFHSHITMAVLKSIFIILSICGCWRPSSWSHSFFKCLAHNLYTFFIALLVSSLSLSQMIGIASIAIDSGEVSDDIYVFLAHFVSCFKMLCLVVNRNNIVKLIDTLGQEPYRPLDDMETNIQTKFDKLSRIWIFFFLRFNIHSYVSLITFTVSHFLFMSLITDFRKRQLTFQAWLPFDDSMTPVVFYLTYAHQMIALTLGAMIHVALDTLISDLLLNICCQIRILENRLTNITNERKVILKLCIRHHECIYGFAADVNETFKFAIFVQFLASTFTVCFTLFQITKISVNSLEFLKMTLFMFGMLIQVYLYCWYGNLVTVKSEEIVYQMFDTDLMELNNDIKKSLLIMMHRTTRPIVIIVMNLFPLNIDSFVSVNS